MRSLAFDGTRNGKLCDASLFDRSVRCGGGDKDDRLAHSACANRRDNSVRQGPNKSIYDLHDRMHLLYDFEQRSVAGSCLLRHVVPYFGDREFGQSVHVDLRTLRASCGRDECYVDSNRDDTSCRVYSNIRFDGPA